jgi:uncharacterized protein (TIGR02118 family)
VLVEDSKGGQTTVFNVIFLVRKGTGKSLEAFTRYWIETHAPFTAKVPGVVAYRCYAATGAPEGEPAVEGVAILSFVDRASYDRAMASPEFATAIKDAPNFQDTDATTALFADEYIIV